MVFDIAILGAGPAAWALAAAFGGTGRSLALIAPEPTTVWSHTYGGWKDQIDPFVEPLLGVSTSTVFSSEWRNVRVIGNRSAPVGRTYIRFDNQQLLSALIERAGPVQLVNASARTIEHNDSSSTIRLTKGRAITSRLVIDATGANSTFVARQHVQSPAMQSAYGIMVSVRNPEVIGGDSATLMDWRGPNRKDASFLYALPMLDGRWLLEETSLARRAPLPQHELRTRLHERLADSGVEIGEVDADELVEFPVEVGMPNLTQRTLGFGAAAALTHPATGYSVVQSLRSAAGVADVVHRALDTGPIRAAEEGWKHMWSDDRLRARRLEQYGLSRLLEMDQAETRAFFDAFFQLSVGMTTTYLSGEASSAEMARVMWELFRKSPRKLQAKLASGNPLMLAKSLLG
jgi:lycopene beta-cyclase